MIGLPLMSNSAQNFPPRRLPSAPPKPVSGFPAIKKPAPAVSTTAPVNTQKVNKTEESFTNESIFSSMQRVLTVNEQPFFRWFQRVFIALIVMSIFILCVAFFVKAPFELAGITIAISWAIVLLIALPEAIIPFKKTKFDLTAETVKVGRTKATPISDLTVAHLDASSKNIRLWLGFTEKNGFWVPVKSSRFRMKQEDLLALRTVIPETSVSNNVPVLDLREPKIKNTPISKDQLISYIESFVSGDR